MSQTFEIEIINKLGLHARASAQLVKIANRFRSSISIIRQEKKTNVKSILGLLILGAAKGTKLYFVIEGEDENSAKEAIISLINNRFGEQE